MIHQTIFVALATLAVSSAFVAPSRMPTARAARLNMVLEAGASAPLGLWDPLGFTKADPLTVKKYREAEIKHGRVSMLAAIGNIVHEVYKPLFDGAVDGPAINMFPKVPVPFFWAFVLAAVGLVEAQTIKKGWKEGGGEGGFIADLKEEYIPGDLGFDPLGIAPKTEEGFTEMQTKELNNGRLAMIAIAGQVAQELVDGKGLIEHLTT